MDQVTATTHCDHIVAAAGDFRIESSAPLSDPPNTGGPTSRPRKAAWDPSNHSSQLWREYPHRRCANSILGVPWPEKPPFHRGQDINIEPFICVSANRPEYSAVFHFVNCVRARWAFPRPPKPGARPRTREQNPASTTVQIRLPRSTRARCRAARHAARLRPGPDGRSRNRLPVIPGFTWGACRA